MRYEENLDGRADLITELLKDSSLLEHSYSLMMLDESKKQSVYDMNDFLSIKAELLRRNQIFVLK